MIGLEKTKAKAGEISSSARALSAADIRRLHDHCFREGLTMAELRQGIVRYVGPPPHVSWAVNNCLFFVQTAYLFAWLLMLRIEEVVRLEFESIDKIPGERELPTTKTNGC